MSTITLDTHKAIKRLIKLGYKEEHAEEFIKIFQEGKDVDLKDLVTKDYLKADLISLKGELKIEILQSEKRIFIAIGGSVITTCTIIIGFLQAMGKL